MRARPAAAAAAAALVLLCAAAPARAADADEEACQPGVTRYVDQPPDAFAQLGIGEAWRLSRGAGILVAVVDSGVDAGNAHLAGAVHAGLDLVDGGDGRTDASGHGTAVAGVIAARQVPGSGLVGVSPEAEILPVRVYADDSADAVRDGRGPDPDRTAQGIRWAAEQGARIIAVPQSTDSDVPALRDAVDEATARGALVVAAAGNAADGQDRDAVRFPAGYAPALAVTAVGSDGAPSDDVTHGVHVEIAAPGQSVLSTFLDAGDCVFAGDAPSTSYATGYAAAAAALVASAHPDEAPAAWEYRLLATALRPDRGGRDPSLGWGIVAPYDAVNFVDDGGAPGLDNPRFAGAPPQAAQVKARPEPEEDPAPGRRAAVGGMAGAASAVLVGALLIARLRPSAARRRTT